MKKYSSIIWYYDITFPIFASLLKKDMFEETYYKAK